MRYIISDIHGCYNEYRQLLEKIKLTKDEDHLYILGDSVDKGPEPIKVLQDVMMRKNVTYMIGNHDYLFLYFAAKLGADLSGTNRFSKEDFVDFNAYLQDGGRTTFEQYIQLPQDEKTEITSFLEKARSFDVIYEIEKKYVLVHAGISGFDEKKSLEEYQITDFILDRMDYKKRYFTDENVHVVSGHTPIGLIKTDSTMTVFEENGHIAIDCGCVYGGYLAAYCIETGDKIYVKAEEKYEWKTL